MASIHLSPPDPFDFKRPDRGGFRGEGGGGGRGGGGGGAVGVSDRREFCLKRVACFNDIHSRGHILYGASDNYIGNAHFEYNVKST